MNIYDTANKLAKEIKDSDEYKIYAELKQHLFNNIEKKEKLSNFEKLQYETQLSAMKGESQDGSKMTELQNQYAQLITDDEVKAYFEAEMKFNVMIGDVNKIIADAIRDIM